MSQEKPPQRTERSANATPVSKKMKAPTPYDPLDLRTLAESMVKVVLEQSIQPLATLRPFGGSGIYVIYYTGDFKPYKPIADENSGGSWKRPIYVGEATRKGGRKGGVLAEGPAGKAIFERLGNHVDSIRSVKNLRVEDFWVRYLVLKDFFIPLCESLLIDRYSPIWNKLIDGFGNKALGGPRQERQQKSMWDVLHPGRPGAAVSANKRFPDAASVEEAIRKFFANEPVPLISTDQALATAEEVGREDREDEEL